MKTKIDSTVWNLLQRIWADGQRVDSPLNYYDVMRFVYVA